MAKRTPTPITIETKLSDAQGWTECAGDLAGPFGATADAERALKKHGKAGPVYRIVAVKRDNLKLGKKVVTTPPLDFV